MNTQRLPLPDETQVIRREPRASTMELFLAIWRVVASTPLTEDRR